MSQPTENPLSVLTQRVRQAPWQQLAVGVLVLAGLTADLIKGHGLHSLGYLAVAFVILVCFKTALDYNTIINDSESIESVNNAAFALRRGSLYGALLIGQSGSLLAPRQGYWYDLGAFVVDGVVIAIVLFAFTFLVDRFVLPRIDNMQELLQGNMSVAVVEASTYLGLGAILCGATAGPGGGTLSLLQFAVVGALSFWVVYLGYDWVRACEVDHEVARNNFACAIETGSFLLGTGIILGFSIAGQYTGWLNDLLSYLASAVEATIYLGVAVVLLDWVFLSRTKLGGTIHHGKEAPAWIVALVTIGLAVLIGVTINA